MGESNEECGRNDQDFKMHDSVCMDPIIQASNFETLSETECDIAVLTIFAGLTLTTVTDKSAGMSSYIPLPSSVRMKLGQEERSLSCRGREVVLQNRSYSHGFFSCWHMHNSGVCFRSMAAGHITNVWKVN